MRGDYCLKTGDKPFINPYVVLREEFDDWAVLFDPETGKGYGLNPSGVYLSKLFDGEHTMEDLVRELTFDVKDVPVDAPEQITDFIHRLCVEGLVIFTIPQAPAEDNAERPQASACTARPSRESTLLMYEPPKLVSLNSGRTASGAGCCEPGSSATGCSSGGAGASADCGSGITAHNCSGGSSVGCWNPCTGYCCHGPGDAVTCHSGALDHCCNSGSSPSIAIGCSSGNSVTGSCANGFGTTC